MNSTLIIIGVVIALGVSAYIGFDRLKKKNLERLFTQIQENIKQVPKQKKHSFLLMMFKESLTANRKKKKKDAPTTDKFNNPKYVEFQLIQMSKVLKERATVKDKTMKRSLALLTEYLKWEKEKSEKVG
jgi:hypothetical protein